MEPYHKEPEYVTELADGTYAKYGLDQHEIDFIETRVKEMA